MSEVKVNKITPTTDCGTVTLGDSGDTVAIPAGVTLTSGGALQNSGTITNTGTITGVAITGTIDNQVNWQTTVKTANFTATAGEGYFCDTTSAAFTVTLPASPSAGDLVGIKDYANTADTNNITIGRNGSNIEGVANDFLITVEGGSITLIYVDATKGWLSTAAAKASDITEQATFVTATGGTITTCGDFKIHTFTGPGTFTVTCAGNPLGSDKIDYLVVAGGGGGIGQYSGGGAGGHRFAFHLGSPSPSPFNAPACESARTVTAQAYPITIGAGGGGNPNSPGSNSIFSTITSAGGGGESPKNGGSGSGAGGEPPGSSNPVGAGNTPSVSPPQGNPGGSNTVGARRGGGGGGAGAAGGTAAGGNGIALPVAWFIGAGGGDNFPEGRYFSGGGGGGTEATPGSPYEGGKGGGGDGGNQSNGIAGSTNTGGGGGSGSRGTSSSGNYFSAAGGSGTIYIKYKYQ
jgi:hypothetical protein